MWSNEHTNKSMIRDKGNGEKLKSLMTILKGDLTKKPGKVLLKKGYLSPKWIGISQQSGRKWEWPEALNAEEDRIWWPRPWKRESRLLCKQGSELTCVPHTQVPWLGQGKKFIKSPSLNPGHQSLCVKLFSVFRVKTGRQKLQSVWLLTSEVATMSIFSLSRKN